jgi:aldehyde oxidoreductase
MEQIMETMKPIYYKAVERAKKEDTPEKRRGVGYRSGADTCYRRVNEDQCTLAIEIAPDGKFIKYDTWQDQGQGGDSVSLQCTTPGLKPSASKKEDNNPETELNQQEWSRFQAASVHQDSII